ncbi:hypothetical protein FOVSG1_014949 [Fusarium oxysporum f. sp. vasinfectum]
MTSKIITVVGITGTQGASVARTFLAEGGWHVRGITRDPSKPSSQEWVSQGVEIVKGDLNDLNSLKSAFAGSSVIFGVTDFWGIVRDPDVQKQAQEQGQQVNQRAYDVEVQQGRNIVDAANATVGTLDRFVLSTLSPTKKWSKGKYTHNYHFDAKWEAVEYLKATYSELAEKTSYLQVALYLTNWKGDLGKPSKQPDGTYLLAVPSDGDGKVAFVDAGHDTGKFPNWPRGLHHLTVSFLGAFTKALVQVKPGIVLLGYSSLLSWKEYAALWGKIHNVECHFHRLDRKVLENAIPGGIGEELADMLEYIGEFGYDGGDPDIVYPENLDVDVPVYTAEEYIKNEDWSAVFGV